MAINTIIQPVIAMLLLTFFMAMWMLFTRIPAMKRLKIHPQKAQNSQSLKELLPHSVVRVANNYNNLFEQPLLFYTICLVIALLNHVDTIHVFTAWTYVVVRIVHSFVQARFDIVMIRFYLFILSWIPLMVLIIRESIKVFNLS